MKKQNMRKIWALLMVTVMMVSCMATTVFATETSGETASQATTGTNFDTVTRPIVELINSLLSPILSIVGAVGALYCVVLGVKYAKAEEPQDREKAKGHLKSAIIGFVLIFVLMLALKLAMPILQNWVASNT